MKTKLILFCALLCWGGIDFAHAQITTGTPSSKVIRTGNRAQAGDFGVYLGATSDMFKGLDKNVKFSALPLINFKYMVTDQMEARVGVELYKTSERNVGDELSTNFEGDPVTLPSKYVNSSSSAMFYPGIAWHFSKRNLLDVYVGAELPIGWDSSTSRNEYTVPEMGENEQYNYVTNSSDVTKRSFVIGLGAFIGLQAYIADLPLALGVEFGISSRFDTGVKYKHVETAGGETQTYFTSALENADDTHYDNLKAKMGEIGGQLRLTLTYYFK